MPIDLDKANSNKEKILSMISTRGPSLPVHLAQTIQLSPLFASAFLSELYAEGKIKISNMKVGSSPLYYMLGQEALLENFVDYLNAREKEAFNLLKIFKILEDDAQNPATRVALRAIKDFAIPLKVQLDGKEKLFWKYSLLADSEFNNLFEKLAKTKKPQKKEQRQLPIQEKTSHTQNQLMEEIKEIREKINQQEQLIKSQTATQDLTLTNNNFLINKPEKKGKKIIKKPVESKFLNDIKDYLSAKDIEILDIIEEKKKELTAKIRIDTLFGKQEYYMIAKDKKKISEPDLTYALQKAQNEKMLALIMSTGELDKKAIEHYKSWKNLVKFEKVKI
ncbi:hypothetical protein J4217_00690 [Candidatus Pacearchaeota archaeon]|nr:hypothetical protein [Candidatus Pacearchaeota archaeon]